MNERVVAGLLLFLSLVSGLDREGEPRARPAARRGVIAGEVHVDEPLRVPPGAVLRVVARRPGARAGAPLAASEREVRGAPPYSYSLVLGGASARAPAVALVRAELVAHGAVILTGEAVARRPAADAALAIVLRPSGGL